MKAHSVDHRSRALRALAATLQVDFTDLSLLHQALVHTSYANECKLHPFCHNERLEFLGDAILDLIISDYLFRTYPQLPEGELTKARAMIVCEPSLAKRARELRIGDYLFLGKGEELSGGRERISILADTFEAIIGAIYLDRGLEQARSFVLNQLQEMLSLIEKGDYKKDYKTLLQEVVQKNSDSKIHYEVLEEHGPDHDKVFKIGVLVNSQCLGEGSGKSKKEAEQRAAQQALDYLNRI
ncbi:ribonuclease iii [Lucifera butyrica]|uniref:Ribonuclease 3 n=1 Tax=Lucifera butyrica TaxID=1351585 RepID=A0A498R2G3_9FIRM|nr:ribonuclease III [Lucifera butyrica]VBB05654.1 ribonuclease iii [Lucifera butyrica]